MEPNARVVVNEMGWVHATVTTEPESNFSTIRIYKCRFTKSTQSRMRPLNAELAGKCSHSDGQTWVRDEEMMGGGAYLETVLVWETCPSVSHNNCIADRTPLIGFATVPIGQPV